MNKAFHKTISSLLIVAFLFTIVFPLRETYAMTSPWWSGSQAHASTNIAPPSLGEGSSLTENDKNHQKVGEPVFIHNGDFIYSHTDATIPSREINTEITRTYKSRSRYNNRFGYGWNMFYNKRIVSLCTGDLFYLDGKLNRYTFTYVDGTNYISPKGVYDTLVQNPDGTFTLTEPHKTVYEFNQDGVLTEIRDRNGNSLHFEYDPVGKLPIIGISVFSNDPDPKIVAYDYKLTKMRDTVGREMTFAYNDSGRLQTITDFNGRVYSCTYDPSTNGDLLSFTTPATEEYPQGLTTTYTYGDHNLKTITDAKSQAYLANYFDANDRVYLQDFGQGHFRLSYDSTTQTTVTDPKGFVTVWTFDSNGNPTSKKEYTQGLRPGDPSVYTTTYTYNANLEKTSVTYPKGNGIKYTFDESSPNQRSKGNVLQIRRKPDMSQPDNDSNDIVTTFTYESNYNFVKTITDPKGNVTTFTYDYELPPEDPNHGTSGNLVKITSPAVTGGTPETKFSYNSYGQLASVTDPNRNITSYEYYANTGYLWKIIQDPSGLNYVTTFIYDAVGNPTSVTDPRGNTTTFEYNALNQLTRTISPAPFSYQTKYTYDKNFNLIKVERQANDQGTLWQTTQYSYTVLDQLETITDPMGYVTTFGYDLNGNRISIQDANHNTATYTYDERNLPWKVTDSLNHVTEYAYDANANQKEIADAKSNKTAYTYDNFNRLEKTTYQDTTFEAYVYDKNSNVKTKTDARSYIINYDYDALNRLDLKTYPDATTVDYVYDLASRLTDAIDARGTIHHDYDSLNRITQVSYPSTRSVSYQYDAVGNRTRLTYPDATYLAYTYDNVNRLITIGSSEQGVLATYTYDALSRRTMRKYANSTQTQYAYNDNGWLKSLENQIIYNPTPPPPKPPPGSPVIPIWPPKKNLEFQKNNNLSSIKNLSPKKFLVKLGKSIQGIFDAYPAYADFISISTFSYTYDNTGNRLTQNAWPAYSNGLSNYTYDTNYQLTDADYPSGSSPDLVHYQLDSVGNRVYTTEDSHRTDYTPNSMNEYSNVGGVTYAYDNNGNLLSDGTNTYEYDYENRLAKATTPNNIVEYKYDALGRRISKKIYDSLYSLLSTRSLTYDGDQIIEELDGADILAAKYYYGTGIDEILKMDRGGDSYWYYHDGLGSVTDLKQQSTSLTQETYSYDAFGKPTIKDLNGNVISQSQFGNTRMFTGREYDQETGLYHYRARTYSPTIGRFLQRDPVGYEDLNLYAYVDSVRKPVAGTDINLYEYAHNDPVNFTDPYGLWYIDINVEGGMWGGGTGGIIIGPEGIYTYGGGGAMAPPPGGFSVMWSPDNPSPGWNVGFQAGVWGGFQRGYSFGKDSRGGVWFTEYGFATPGASLTGYYVSEPWKWPWLRNKKQSKEKENKCKK